MSNCNKATNNKYFNCPPRMADGRMFTSYAANTDVNGKLKNKHAPKGSNEYRHYLTKNAMVLINSERLANNETNGCMNESRTSTMLAEQSQRTCDKQSCSIKMVNSDGLGTGRGYYSSPETSDCKFSYIEKTPCDKTLGEIPVGYSL